MFDTSRDILYLVISFCVLWVTVFLCWMFYYAMRLMRSTNKVIEEFRARLQSLTEAINYIRGKVENISGLVSLVTQGAGGFVKKVVTNKAKEWMNRKSGKFNDAAKEAVDKAVEAAAEKMRKTARKFRK